MTTYAEKLQDPGGKLTVRRGARKAPAVFRGDQDCYALVGFGHRERRFPSGLSYGEVPVYVVETEDGTRFVFVRTDAERLLDGVPRTYYIPVYPHLLEEVFTDGRAALFALDIDFAPGEMGREFAEHAGLTTAAQRQKGQKMDATKQDIAAVEKLRKYYRENFRNGDSDESFVTWIETVLAAIREAK